MSIMAVKKKTLPIVEEETLYITKFEPNANNISLT